MESQYQLDAREWRRGRGRKKGGREGETERDYSERNVMKVPPIILKYLLSLVY